MAGTLSSLGIGSSGALNAETIEKLKANDVTLQIDPIKAKIENFSQKNQAYDLLNSLLSTMSGSTGSIGSDLLYLNINTSVTGSAASVNASSGVSPQSFSLEVVDLATKEIQQSDQFASETALVASADGTINLSVGSESFDIDITTGTSLEDLAQKINDQAGSAVKAQVLNVAEGDYRLVMTSVETGLDQDITVTDAGAILSQNITQATAIQEGSDAHFKYNGIDFTRSSNLIDDIITGVEITLEDAGTSNVTIEQNIDGIVEEMQSFVTAYNTLFKELNDSLTSDVENNSVGIFNGDNTLKNLAREINKILFSTDSNNDSLAGFFSNVNSSGLSQTAFNLNESGTLTFNENVFREKYNEDPSAAEAFLKYSTNEDGTQLDGLFARLDNFLDDQIGFDGSFTKFGDNLNTQITNLEDEAIRAQELIDSRYDTMFLRFAAYDRIIGSLERQFSALSLQIEAAINAKN